MTNLIAAEIHRLTLANSGVLRPEAVVEAAREPANPLHSHFEWDDSVAGAHYRLDQARTLIRSVKVDIRIDHLRVDAIAYVHDPDAGAEQGYVHVASLRSDSERAERALEAELSRLARAADRARNVAAALGLGDIEAQLLDAINVQEVQGTAAA